MVQLFFLFKHGNRGYSLLSLVVNEYVLVLEKAVYQDYDLFLQNKSNTLQLLQFQILHVFIISK